MARQSTRHTVGITAAVLVVVTVALVVWFLPRPDRRDDRIQNAHETGEFHEVTFTLTEPIELDGDPRRSSTTSSS